MAWASIARVVRAGMGDGVAVRGWQEAFAQRYPALSGAVLQRAAGMLRDGRWLRLAVWWLVAFWALHILAGTLLRWPALRMPVIEAEAAVPRAAVDAVAQTIPTAWFGTPLFGAPAGADTAGDAQPVAATRLALRLQGVVLAADGGESLALIVADGAPRLYRIDEVIDAQRRVRLLGVERDRVILDHAGRSEFLPLFEGEVSVSRQAERHDVALIPGAE